MHNVVHPYRFTKEMLASMRVLRQLDEKFIVGVVSYEGEILGLSVRSSHSINEVHDRSVIILNFKLTQREIVSSDRPGECSLKKDCCQ